MAGIDDIAFQQPLPIPSEGTKQVEETDRLSLLMVAGVWFPFCSVHSRGNKAQQHRLQILLSWDLAHTCSIPGLAAGGLISSGADSSEARQIGGSNVRKEQKISQLRECTQNKPLVHVDLLASTAHSRQTPIHF